jgi:hypothetical protein
MGMEKQLTLHIKMINPVEAQIGGCLAHTVVSENLTASHWPGWWHLHSLSNFSCLLVGLGKQLTLHITPYCIVCDKL